MVTVNPDEREHVASLTGALLGAVRTTFFEHDWDGLRPSHVRVLSSVPEGGCTVTELATRVGMTKQGCGQFVTALVGRGQLAQAPGTDRRVRLVTRTVQGDRTLVRFAQVMDDLEARWRAQVGERRNGTFRSVLVELAGSAGASPHG